MGKVDLHIHSNFSDDGELEVEDIINISKGNGMSTISITDHNSIKGIKRALAHGEKLGIEVIPGIEIDCTYNSVNLHVLGYYIDYNNKEFEELEENIFKQEKEAALEKIRKFRLGTGINLEEEEVLEKAKGGVVTGELIAEIILNREDNLDNELLKPYLKGGKRSDMPYVNFYWDFFAQGRIAYVPINYMSLKEAISLIKRSKGIPVIAHPGNNLKSNMEMIRLIIKEGVEGIEVFSQYHSQEQCEYFYNIAKELNTLITCGSDFHGKNKPHIKIGDCNCPLEYNSIINPLKEFLR